MNDIQPTPGPWVFAYGSVYQGASLDALNDETAVRIALMDRNEHRTSPCERDANARLCAAAPDLLAALVAVLRHCVTPAGFPDKGKGRTDHQQAAYNAARAAIARATNPSP